MAGPRWTVTDDIPTGPATALVDLSVAVVVLAIPADLFGLLFAAAASVQLAVIGLAGSIQAVLAWLAIAVTDAQRTGLGATARQASCENPHK
jgi:hypothetical protein